LVKNKVWSSRATTNRLCQKICYMVLWSRSGIKRSRSARRFQT